ncbi:PQQ-dependent sugar dehydrogenase [Rickettsiales bacterium]|nr:PQQ-dependent sugar dehydrogenase [Rickettsiales bacterium]
MADERIKNYRNYNLTKTKFKLTEIVKGLNYPWGLTFIDNERLLITEKNGKLLRVNINNKEITEIKHNIQSLQYDGGSSQGGLLDVLYHEGYTYFSYSHIHNSDMMDGQDLKYSSTAIARGELLGNEIKNLEILLIGTPGISTNKHWGSRLVIKDNFLYASFGERGKGMIAQDPTKHPGSIIRINLDGTIPEDNPAFMSESNWLPEIYQIGVRNPQGMTLSPNDNEIYFSQHGPMGGDNLGIVKYAGNYGWKNIAWGGKEYTWIKIGDEPFKDEFDKPIIAWVPSMAIGQISFYNGDIFSEWNGDLIGSATKAGLLFRLDFENNIIINEEIILNQELGRIRDFEIDRQGNIFIIIDDEDSSLWKLSK